LTKKAHNLWGTPRKITQQIRERKVSWLELFSDLVYVVIIHNITIGFADHFNWGGLLTFLILFYLVFNSWNNLAIYFDLHGNDSVRTTFLTLVQILLVALFAGSITTAFDGQYLATALVYFAIQLLFMYMWWTTARYDPEHMLTTRPYLIYYTIGAVLLLLIPLTKTTGIQELLLLGVIFFDFFALLFESPNFNREFKQRHIAFQISPALLERYGQFTMIVLGESLANLIDLFDEGLTLPKIGLFLLLVISTIAIWWLYYSLMDDITVKERNYQGLVFFRGLHINFILFLSLEGFFLTELADKSTLWTRLGYLISLVLVLVSLTAMVINRQQHTVAKKQLCISGSIVLIAILLSTLLPNIWMLILIDLVLLSACVYRERNMLNAES